MQRIFKYRDNSFSLKRRYTMERQIVDIINEGQRGNINKKDRPTILKLTGGLSF